MTEQPVTLSPEERARWLLCIRFFDRGFGYYVCGRFALANWLSPIGATNLHHAIEMFLKGYLVRRHRFDRETLKRFSHRLDKLWAEFRTQRQEPIYDRFTQTIAELNKFEELRYPPPETPGSGPRQGQAYYGTRPTRPRDPEKIPFGLVRDEIDYLVIVLYQLAGMHPHGGTLQEAGKFSLLDGNQCADLWDMRVGN